MNNEIKKIAEETREEYISFLKDVVEIESPTDYKEGLDKVSAYFIEKAKEKGFKTEIFPQEVAGDVAVITLNPEVNERPICLSGHIDTVHALGYFGYPAVTYEGNKMIGPGICDCKGSCVCGFWVLDILSRIGYKKRPVMLLLQTDEETSSVQSNHATINYICERSKDAVAFFNIEPCYTGNGITMVRKGICKLKFTIKGIADHAAECYNGANALVEAAYKIIELEKYKDPNSITMSCDVLHAGKAVNTVPDLCEFYVDSRFVDEERYAKIKEIAKEVANTVHIKGTSCEVSEMSYRPSMPLSKLNTDLLEKVNEILDIAGLETLVVRNSGGGSDAAYVTQANIPVVDSIGIIGDYAHKREEYIDLDRYTIPPIRLATIIEKL